MKNSGYINFKIGAWDCGYNPTTYEWWATLSRAGRQLQIIETDSREKLIEKIKRQ